MDPRESLKYRFALKRVARGFRRGLLQSFARAISLPKYQAACGVFRNLLPRPTVISIRKPNEFTASRRY